MAAARKVEPRFDDNSVNNSLVVANIGESVALHCRIWMKQVTLDTAECQHSHNLSWAGLVAGGGPSCVNCAAVCAVSLLPVKIWNI